MISYHTGVEASGGSWKRGRHQCGTLRRPCAGLTAWPKKPPISVFCNWEALKEDLTECTRCYSRFYETLIVFEAASEAVVALGRLFTVPRTIGSLLANLGDRQ
jgi:hypothetical protein